MTTYLDIDKIEFERNQSGFLGWKSDKIEQINGYNCKAYKANNLQLVTKTRVEHLSELSVNNNYNNLDENEEENMSRSNKGLTSFLTNLFNGTEQKYKCEKLDDDLTAEQYFSQHIQVPDYLGRKIDEKRKIQTFNATLSLCENYPLSLHEQILPIVELMALNNSHFKKLKEFITLQLPSGFPIKIEIPLYRVITAKVTFGNIHAINTPVDKVTCITDSLGTPACLVDELVFTIPNGYRSIGHTLPQQMASREDEDDILLQLAIQQSLSTSNQFGDQEQVTALEMFDYPIRRQRNNSLNNLNDSQFDDEDEILSRVIAESLLYTNQSQQIPINNNNNSNNALPTNQDLNTILELSRREQEEREEQLRREEEEFQRILQLSLIEK
jgi:ankyrin repeat domain-containing protein 13